MIEELMKRRDELADKEYGIYPNSRFLFCLGFNAGVAEMQAQNDSLKAQVEIAWKALEFYADEKKWIPYHHALSGMDPEADIDGENGVKARQALEQIQKMRGGPQSLKD